MKKHIEELKKGGCTIIKNMVAKPLLSRLKNELQAAIDKEAAFHGTTNYRDYGMLLACPMYGGAFLELLETKGLFDPVNAVLGESCIIHVYTSSSLPPGGVNYATRIHRDSFTHLPASFPFYAILIALDDFTPENGAMQYMPASHELTIAPTGDEFETASVPLLLYKGDVFYFDSRLWHKAGENSSAGWRHAVAMGISPPQLKQKVDLPGILKEQRGSLSRVAKQKLGFESIPATTLEAFYGLQGERSFKAIK